MKIKRFIQIFLSIYFFLPFLLFLKYFQPQLDFDHQEVLWALKNSFLQGMVVSLFVCVLASIASFSLFQLSRQVLKWTRKLLLLPQVLPALFTILILFNWLQPFPMGYWGVVVALSTVYVGYAIVALHSAAQEKMGALGVVAEMYNIRPLRFFLKVYLPLIYSDLKLIFILVFTFTFSSFSIPLVVGGGRSTNLEVLIFEKIFIDQNWALACTLSLGQTLFLGFLSYAAFTRSYIEKVEYIPSNVLKSWWGIGIIYTYIFIYVLGYLRGLALSLNDFQQIFLFSNEIGVALMNSLIQLVLVLGLQLGLLYVSLKYYFLFSRNHLFAHLLSVSTVVVGFSIYLTFPQGAGWDLIKIPLAISFVFFPPLYKTFIEKALEQMSSQFLVGRIFNIGSDQFIFRVALPQMKKILFLWISFLTIYFLSDYAVLRSLGTQNMNLGLLGESFLSSYRLNLSFIVSAIILVTWGVLIGLVYIGLEFFLGED